MFFVFFQAVKRKTMSLGKRREKVNSSRSSVIENSLDDQETLPLSQTQDSFSVRFREEILAYEEGYTFGLPGFGDTRTLSSVIFFTRECVLDICDFVAKNYDRICVGPRKIIGNIAQHCLANRKEDPIAFIKDSEDNRYKFIICSQIHDYPDMWFKKTEPEVQESSLPSQNDIQKQIQDAKQEIKTLNNEFQKVFNKAKQSMEENRELKRKCDEAQDELKEHHRKVQRIKDQGFTKTTCNLFLSAMKKYDFLSHIEEDKFVGVMSDFVDELQNHIIAEISSSSK